MGGWKPFLLRTIKQLLGSKNSRPSIQRQRQKYIINSASFPGPGKYYRCKTLAKIHKRKQRFTLLTLNETLEPLGCGSGLCCSQCVTLPLVHQETAIEIFTWRHKSQPPRWKNTRNVRLPLPWFHLTLFIILNCQDPAVLSLFRILFQYN